MTDILVIFDDQFDIKPLLRKTEQNKLKFHLFALTSNHFVINSVAAKLKTYGDVIHVKSPNLINVEVNRLQKTVHVWSEALDKTKFYIRI